MLSRDFGPDKRREGWARMTESVDVLFINPGDRKRIYQALGDEFSAIEPPVFAGLFATFVRKRGYSAAIYDVPAMAVTAEEAARVAVEDFDARLIVFPVYGFQPSASSQNMDSASKIAKLIKAADPEQPILFTGTHPAALPERTMREEAIDFVCDREGPVTIVKTLEALVARISDFSKIPSLWWRQDRAIMKPGSHEALLTDLDGTMPGIAWDLLPMERYRAHNWHCFQHIGERQPYAAIHTSLGCPFRCSFCCINAPFGQSSYRMWSPETVVREIDTLVEEFGVKNIKFVDEMFVLNKRHVAAICDLLIERGHKLNIWAYARVDTVNDSLVEKMKQAGIEWIALGIESASEHVRDGADKIYTNDDIVDTVRRVQAVGINVIGNYMFGLPDDTRERMQQTLDMAIELNCEFANFYSTMAYPGSGLYQQALNEGRALPEQWHQFSQHAYDALPLANDYCSAAEILGFRDEAWQTYFRSPRYLDMVRSKFGQPVVEHIGRMVDIKLPRKLLEHAVA
jgi:radical SAM superfamily enzyme YgiQ (UPF0313 family)